jgi:uncharacterized Zn finger protein
VAKAKLGSLTPARIEGLAGDRSFARGVAYHAEGRVEVQPASSNVVRATVRGSIPYEVELSEHRGNLRWSCSCPMGDDGVFCKHCVAVALALVGDIGPADERLDPGAYLRSLDREELVDLVLDQAGEDWRLRERLSARAAAMAGSSVDVAAWRKRLDAAFRTGSFVDYSHAPAWAKRVDEMLDAVDDLLDAGHAEAVITLAERAHLKAEKAMEHIDDSDGWITNIFHRVADLHLRACEVARPEPVQLARRLVELELPAELDTFHRAAARYANVLGPAGLAEYRALVEPQWRALDRRADDYRGARFRIEQAMIGLALGSRDPDLLMTVMRSRLRSPYDYLEIAEALADAGRTDEAIEWARNGLTTFADRWHQTPPLREFLAGLLRDGGDDAGALELFWGAFVRMPKLDAYRRLMEEADGASEKWKQRALLTLRTRVAEADAGQEVLASMLVEILSYEGDADAAWDTASTYGCDHQLWLTLARAREKMHPLDAIPIYEREVERQIDMKSNGGYRAGVKLLDRIRGLSERAGARESFDELVGDVRARHKQKRNLIALLDQKGW